MLGKHPADRLNTGPVTMIVDELKYHGSRGASSRAKNEDAANRISLARLGSRASALRALMRCASLVVVPERLSASIAACLHQLRSVSAFTSEWCSILAAAQFSYSFGSSVLALEKKPHRSLM